MIRRWLQRRRDRRLHDDRDYECKFWWGDRGGYDFRLTKCPICNPEGV